MLHLGGVCGPLCQHPGCWVAQRNLTRNVPTTAQSLEPIPSKTRRRRSLKNAGSAKTERVQPRRSGGNTVTYSEDYEDYDLPKQRIVNLLDEYGEDPNDRFPSKFKGRPMHERSKSIMSALELQQRAGARDSAAMSRGRAPQHTPASTHPEKRATIGKVEVQEVFEFEELSRKWNDTFQPKQYYVWVPNPNRKKKPLPVTGISPRLNKTRVRDVTEDLVPQEVEIQREATIQQRQQRAKSGRNVSASSRLETNPETSHIQQQQQQPQKVPGQKEPYYGIYEILDLPRDVLGNILQYITERDLLDRQRFTQALLAALPKLEMHSREIALAKSEILRQKPMDLYDSTQKPTSRQTDLSKFKQPLFIMDPTDTELAVKSEGVSSVLPITEAGEEATDETKVGDQQKTISADIVNRSHQHTPRSLNKHTPVPPIGKSPQVVATTETTKVKIPTVSIGLPELPSGVRHTMPFRYKGVQFDFSLAPVSSPPIKSEEFCSTTRSDKDSTLHVTVPSMPSSEDATALVYPSHTCDNCNNANKEKMVKKSRNKF